MLENPENNEIETDEQVAKKVQSGDKNAYGILIDRYTDKMQRYARRFMSDSEDITDLVQDVFVKAYININSFNAEMRFSPWIYRIAHNLFVNKLAWKSVRKLVSIDTDEFFPSTLAANENVEREAMRSEDKIAIEKILNTLDDKYKTPIILFYFEEMSYEQIGEVMQIPVNTVGIRIKRAKDKLKIKLQGI
jgi:RNA polymerase sigma-70 factor, ECF subfamily